MVAHYTRLQFGGGFSSSVSNRLYYSKHKKIFVTTSKHYVDPDFFLKQNHQDRIELKEEGDKLHSVTG